MKKIAIFSFFFLLSSHLKAQNNVYSIYFDKNGHFSSINSNEFLEKSKELEVRISINSNDSLLKLYYKPYLEKHISTVQNLSNSDIVEKLDKYWGISKEDIKSIINSSKCYFHNFPMELKNIYGYNSSLGLPDLDPNKCNGSLSKFNPYTIFVTGYPEKPESNTVTEKSIPVTFSNNWLIYPVKLKKTANIEKISYKIFFNKPEAELFNLSIRNFPPTARYRKTLSDIDTAKVVLDEVNKLINNPEADINTYKKEILDYKYSLISLNDSISSYFISQKDLVKQWLWYTNGYPSLNPFLDTNIENKVISISDKINIGRQDSLNLSIVLNSAEKKFENYKEILKTNLKDKLTLSETNTLVIPKISDFIDTIVRYQSKLFNIKLKLDSLKKDLEISKIKSKNNQLAEQEMSKKDIFLYDGTTFAGGRRKMIYFRNYDRANDLSLFQKLPTAYDETSKVYILIENETRKNKVVESIKPISDISPPSSMLSTALDGLSISQLSNAIDKINNKSQSLENTTGINIKQTLDSIIKLGASIKYYTENLLPPPNISTPFQSDETPQFRTDYHLATFPDTAKSSYIYNQVVIQDSHKDTLKFRVNKLFYVLPTVGLAYSMADAPEVLLNSNGSVKDVNYFNGFGLMLGLKFYPFGSPIYDPKFIYSNSRRPHFDYRKFHFILGANAIHPLKQFYIGTGIDFWSGFSINGGLHFISKTQDKLVRQSLESKNYLDYCNPYVSLNLDVAVAVKFINILKR